MLPPPESSPARFIHRRWSDTASDTASDATSDIGLTAAHVGLRRWMVLGMIMTAAVSGSINKQMLPLIVGPLKTDMGLSDAQIGIITGLAPGLLSGVATLGLGWLADRTARQWLLAVSILGWSAATVVMGTATSFIGLVIGAFALSMGEMALLPIFNSAVPDMFPDRMRRQINLFYGAVIVASAGITLAICGLALSLLTEHRAALPGPLSVLAPWRVGLLLTAVLGIPVALGVVLAGPIPRTASFRAAPSPTAFFRRHFRATFGLYAAFCLFGIGSSAVLSWTTIYMMRAHSLTPAQLGAGVGAVFLASSFLGILGSGFALKRLTPRHGVLAPLKLYLGAMLLSAVPGAVLPFVSNLGLAYVVMTAQFTLIFAAMAHNFSLVQDLSPANARGRASGLFALSVGVLPAFAPLLVGMLSDRLHMGAAGLMVAISAISVPAYCLGAITLVATSGAYREALRQLSAGSPS